MHGRRSVVVTGVGLVSPHGSHAGHVFDMLMAGISAIRVHADDTMPIPIGRVNFAPEPWFTPQQLLGTDRVSQLAVAAASTAAADAGLAAATPEDDERRGVYIGCGMGGAAAQEAAYRAVLAGRRPSPSSVVAAMCNAPAAHVAIRERAAGPVMTYSVACASSAVAIGEAARAIAAGDIDVAYAGGAEALLESCVLQTWQAMRVLASPGAGDPAHACKPFLTGRNGLVLAEGAAVLLLEEREHAMKRGARIYAELAGYAVRCDAHHLTRPTVDGQRRTILAALRDAGLTPDRIGYCNAHGTATQVGDIVEAHALRSVWQDRLPHLRVGSTKALHGHLLGAAGALEAVITVMALDRRQLPGHPVTAPADPECGLPLVGEGGESMPDLAAALSNSFAFGGTNAALVFRRANDSGGRV